MAVTNNQKPAAYVPYFNEQTFESTSTLSGNAGFMYRIIVTDLITGASDTYNIKQAPVTAELKWYANVFVNQYVKHYVPNNLYGWKKCTDALRKIRVNVGEYTTAGGYVAGANYDYVVWNGVLRPLDWVGFNANDYLYATTTNQISLNQESAANTYTDKSHFLYFLGASSSPSGILIDTYNSAGTFIAQSSIANPFYLTADYTERYTAIDIGLKGLTNIASGLVTGAYPIITSNVASYNVSDAGALQTYYKVMTIQCEPTFTIYTAHYLTTNGRFETLHFNKLSKLEEKIEKKTYRQNPNTLSSNQWKYTRDSQWERTLSSTGQDNLILNTDWLTETQVLVHKKIISSPLVYLDYGSSLGLVPVRVVTSSIPENKNFNEKLFGITLEVEPTYKNNYQNG
jgi:hypothetical protein